MITDTEENTMQNADQIVEIVHNKKPQPKIGLRDKWKCYVIIL